MVRIVNIIAVRQRHIDLTGLSLHHQPHTKNTLIPMALMVNGAFDLIEFRGIKDEITFKNIVSFHQMSRFDTGNLRRAGYIIAHSALITIGQFCADIGIGRRNIKRRKQIQRLFSDIFHLNVHLDIIIGTVFDPVKRQSKANIPHQTNIMIGQDQ